MEARAEGSVRVVLGSWDELGEPARKIRIEVFVEEQGVPAELEFDQMDPVSVHALAAQAAGEALGTGRLLPDGRIGRMAVVQQARGTGVGSALLLALMQAARQRGHREVELFAQVAAQPFYRRFGFVAFGSQFDDAGIAHIAMRAAI